jgi:hypothetical protein
MQILTIMEEETPFKSHGFILCSLLMDCATYSRDPLSLSISTVINAFNFPIDIAIYALRTVAYVTNLIGNNLSFCPINNNGSFGMAYE